MQKVNIESDKIVEIVLQLTTDKLENRIDYLRNYILNMIKTAKEAAIEFRERYKEYIKAYTKILLIYLIELYKRTGDPKVLKKIVDMLGVFL